MSTPAPAGNPENDATNVETGQDIAVDGPQQQDTGEPRRTVVFPQQDPDYGIEERERPTGGLNRPRGAEMRRELTKEEKELAAAGYDHIIAEKDDPHSDAKGDGDDLKQSHTGKMDITEHSLSLDDLENTFLTSFVVKEPTASHGLTPKEAADRLIRDGKNILTPPKKKSAFMKVN